MLPAALDWLLLVDTTEMARKNPHSVTLRCMIKGRAQREGEERERMRKSERASREQVRPRLQVRANKQRTKVRAFF